MSLIPTEWYAKLLGKEVKYFNLQEKRIQTGILKEFKVKEDKEQFAIIESMRLQFLPNQNEYYSTPEQSKEEAAGVSVEDSPFSFKCGETEYEKVEHPKFKSGEQVVWNLTSEERDPECPLIGRIQEVGRSIVACAAIVQFDEPTQHLPFYISEEPINRNVVMIDELIPLQNWTEFWNPHSIEHNTDDYVYRFDDPLTQIEFSNEPVNPTFNEDLPSAPPLGL